MAISIKDPGTDQLAREVAKLTGESLTDAINTALRERLQRLRRRPASDPTLINDLMEIAKRCAALPVHDDRSPDEILGYDENGLPN
jgi:antitoxin VapB